MEFSDQPPTAGFHTGSPFYRKLRERALELATLNERPGNEPSGADLSQARNELLLLEDNKGVS